MLTTSTENYHYYRLLQAGLELLNLQPGESYQTPVGDKLSVPVIDGYLGLDVLDDKEHPEITNTHLVIARVAAGEGQLSVRYFATADMVTREYLRPGVLQRVDRGERRMLVEPDLYDGYQMTVTETGEVTIEGLRGIEPAPLPVFDLYPDSATAFLMASYKSAGGLVKRARRTSASSAA